MIWLFQLIVVVASMSTASVVTWLGFYKPPIAIGVGIYCIACGLITTFSVNQPLWRGYGFQILAGIGLGMCLDQVYLAVQAALNREDTSVGVALLMFGHTLSGYTTVKVHLTIRAIVTAVAQAIFINSFLHEILQRLPDLSPHEIIAAGPIGIRQLVSPEDFGYVAEAFQVGFRNVALLCLSFSCAGFLMVFGIEGKNIKGMDRMAAYDR